MNTQTFAGRIYTSDDKALEEREQFTWMPSARSMKDHRSRILFHSHSPNIGRPWNGNIGSGDPILAYINGGCWLVRCDNCDLSDYVSYADPIYYCFGCGNEHQGRVARRVIFPDNREEIEAILLARPVLEGFSPWATQRAKAAQPLKKLRRDWLPGQSADDLRAENARAGL